MGWREDVDGAVAYHRAQGGFDQHNKTAICRCAGRRLVRTYERLLELERPHPSAWMLRPMCWVFGHVPAEWNAHVWCTWCGKDVHDRGRLGP